MQAAINKQSISNAKQHVATIGVWVPDGKGKLQLK